MSQSDPTGSPVPPHENPGPAAYAGPPPDADSRTMGMLCHLLGIFTTFLGPLIIWLIKKDASPFVDDQGKEALNFNVTCTIIYILCPFTFRLAFPLMGLVTIGRIVFALMGTMQANQGIAYRYPLTFRIIK